MDRDRIARDCAARMWSDDNASQALGIDIDVTEAGAAIARMKIRSDMVNGLGVCHGGFVFTLADTAFAFACNGYDQQTFAASCNIDFLRPAKLGDELLATASEEYRGRRSGFYTVSVRNQDNNVVALFRGRSVTNREALLIG